jgi:hypothetical protein
MSLEEPCSHLEGGALERLAAACALAVRALARARARLERDETWKDVRQILLRHGPRLPLPLHVYLRARTLSPTRSRDKISERIQAACSVSWSYTVLV